MFVHLSEGTCFSVSRIQVPLGGGGVILAVRYESLIAQYSSVPATIAYGHVQCSKSEATRVALPTVGLTMPNFFNEIFSIYEPNDHVDGY